MTDKTTRVGVLQLNSNDEVERNLAALARWTRRAAKDGARLIVVPECFAQLGREDGKFEVAESLAPEEAPGPILAQCAALAKELEVELVLGGFWEKGATADKVRNACVHLRADGQVAAIYRKIHLFDVDLADGTRLVESETVEPGTQTVVTDTAFGKLGLSVCYDVRFPELYRKLVDEGAIALTVPAAFTLHTGKDHWHILLRARAIEQQSYVLAAAQTGRHVNKDGSSRRVSYGHALIADPWGTVLAECGEGEGCAVATIDPEFVAKVRRELPSLKHRRLG